MHASQYPWRKRAAILARHLRRIRSENVALVAWPAMEKIVREFQQETLTAFQELPRVDWQDMADFLDRLATA